MWRELFMCINVSGESSWGILHISLYETQDYFVFHPVQSMLKSMYALLWLHWGLNQPHNCNYEGQRVIITICDHFGLKCWFTMFIAHFLLLCVDWNWFMHTSVENEFDAPFFFPVNLSRADSYFFTRGHQHLPLAFVPGQDTKLLVMPFLQLPLTVA